MLPALGAASQVAPAEAARIGAVLRAALSGATIKAYALRLTTYAEWAAAIAQAMRGLRRERPQKPAQVTGLTCEVIAKIEATACAPRKGRGHSMESAKAATRRGHVDIALVRTMRDGFLRRSEAAALKWQDLSTESDGSARLHIARSKTDQEARGHVAYLTPARHSGRVGCAQDLAARGADLTELQVAGRWQSAAMPALYARNQLAGRGAVAKYLT